MDYWPGTSKVFDWFPSSFSGRRSPGSTTTSILRGASTCISISTVTRVLGGTSPTFTSISTSYSPSPWTMNLAFTSVPHVCSPSFSNFKGNRRAWTSSGVPSSTISPISTGA